MNWLNDHVTLFCEVCGPAETSVNSKLAAAEVDHHMTDGPNKPMVFAVAAPEMLIGPKVCYKYKTCQLLKMFSVVFIMYVMNYSGYIFKVEKKRFVLVSL